MDSPGIWNSKFPNLLSTWSWKRSEPSKFLEFTLSYEPLNFSLMVLLSYSMKPTTNSFISCPKDSMAWSNAMLGFTAYGMVHWCMVYLQISWTFWVNGHRSWGMRGTSPPRIWSRGLMQIVPLRRSVLWPSKYAKIRFRPGFCPGLRWGSSQRSPRPSSLLERRHPSPYPIALGTDPLSALVMRPPQKSSQIYAYVWVTLCIQLLKLAFVPL